MGSPAREFDVWHLRCGSWVLRRHRSNCCRIRLSCSAVSRTCLSLVKHGSFTWCRRESRACWRLVTRLGRDLACYRPKFWARRMDHDIRAWSLQQASTHTNVPCRCPLSLQSRLDSHGLSSIGRRMGHGPLYNPGMPVARPVNSARAQLADDIVSNTLTFTSSQSEVGMYLIVSILKQ